MRIIQTIASTRLDHGGTSRSVPALCNALATLHADSHLLTTLPSDSSIACNLPQARERVHLVSESRRFKTWHKLNSIRSELHQLAAGHADVIVHDHGVWLASNYAVARYCRRNGIPRVVSPRGMIGSWAMNHGRFKKRLAWWLYQGRDLASAQAFHVTSEQEANEVRDLGFQQPIAVVPNGIEFPANLPGKNAGHGRQALFLSRVHPKKGLINLIQAWHAAQPSADWRLVIAGPDEGGHRSEVESEVARLGLQSIVSFVGNVEGDAKWQLYIDSDLFVLPSFNENFGIVIAEAMAAGLPVITTKATPWKVIEVEDLGWWIDLQNGELTSALHQALSMDASELRDKGIRAREHIKGRFDWLAVAKSLTNFYGELLDGTR